LIVIFQVRKKGIGYNLLSLSRMHYFCLDVCKQLDLVNNSVRGDIQCKFKIYTLFNQWFCLHGVIKYAADFEKVTDYTPYT